MFNIEYKGGNAVVIATKKTTLISDPKLSLIGLNDLSTAGAIELATEPRFAVNHPEATLRIDGPGEYEVADFSIRGVPARRHIDAGSSEKLATNYAIEVGDVRIALFGNIDAGKLTDEQLESLGVVDIAILPVGGNGYTLDATAAAELVRQIDPKVVVPVHYADPALKYEVPQDPLSVFVTELGAPVETTAKYRVKSAATLPETLTLVEITRS